MNIDIYSKTTGKRATLIAPIKFSAMPTKPYSS